MTKCISDVEFYLHYLGFFDSFLIHMHSAQSILYSIVRIVRFFLWTRGVGEKNSWIIVSILFSIIIIIIIASKDPVHFFFIWVPLIPWWELFTDVWLCVRVFEQMCSIQQLNIVGIFNNTKPHLSKHLICNSEGSHDLSLNTII